MMGGEALLLRHDNVGHQQVRLESLHHPQRHAAIAGGEGGVAGAGEALGDQAQEVRVILCHQHDRPELHRARRWVGTGRSIERQR